MVNKVRALASRLVSNSFDKPRMEADLQKSLAAGKSLSDFIGMLTRMAFCFLVGFYALQGDFGVWKFFQLNVALVFVGLGIIMQIYISLIAVDFAYLEISQGKFGRTRPLALIVGLLFYTSSGLALVVGIYNFSMRLT